MTIAQNRRPGRQDLSRVSGGTLTGRGGNTQQLGAAAQRRLQGQQPAKPAWQQNAAAGIGGQGSAAANRAALAARQKPDILTAMPPEKPGMGRPIDLPGKPGMTETPGINPGADLAAIASSGGLPAGGMGGPGSDMGFMSGGGFMGEPMPFGGGMASFTKPGAIGQMAQGAGGPMGAAGPMGGPPKPPGVNSNPFAQVGTAQDGEPLQAAQGRAGQAGRIAQLIQRLRGGGQMAPDPMQFARPGGSGADMRAF